MVGDDSGEEEFPVEEICGDRGLEDRDAIEKEWGVAKIWKHKGLADGGWKVLVEWDNGERTWEPYGLGWNM